MIIEFFGISGVGKTTLSKKFFEKETKKGKNILWPRFYLYEKSSWLKRNILKLRGVIAAAVSSPKMASQINQIFSGLHIGGKDRIILTYNYLFNKYLFTRCRNSSADYLFDEGIFQLIWATFLRTDAAVEPRYIEQICSLFPRPDKLIIIDAETNVIIERLQKRGRKTKILESVNLAEKINAMKKKQTAIVDCCLQEGLISQKQIEYWDNN